MFRLGEDEEIGNLNLKPLRKLLLKIDFFVPRNFLKTSVYSHFVNSSLNIIVIYWMILCLKIILYKKMIILKK